MAERRMFSKKIVDTDCFIEMPLSTRLLYYDLSMRADDDGFVSSPKKIARMIGCSDDDLKLLVIKKYIIPFDSGVCVIKDWRIHNYIRSDRYRETIYTKEKRMLRLCQNGTYQIADDGMTIGIPDDNQLSYQRYTQDRLELGKDNPPIVPPGDAGVKSGTELQPDESLPVQTAQGSGAKETPVDHSMTLVEERFARFWKAYPKRTGKGAAEKAWKKIRPNTELFDKIMSALALAVKTEQWQRENGRFIPLPATWLNQKRWEDDYPREESHNFVN